LFIPLVIVLPAFVPSNIFPVPLVIDSPVTSPPILILLTKAVPKANLPVPLIVGFPLTLYVRLGEPAKAFALLN
jgi:hypothetical protein